MDRFPLSAQAVGGIGVVVLMGLAGYFGLLVPKWREIRTLKAQLAREAPASRPVKAGPAVAPITEAEQKLWGELEERLRGRYPGQAELPKAMGVLAQLARASGLELAGLDIQRPPPGLEPTKAPPPPPFQPPPELAVNPWTIRLLARPRYRELVEFLDKLGRAPVYAAPQTLDVKRTEDQLTLEASFATLRWGK